MSTRSVLRVAALAVALGLRLAPAALGAGMGSVTVKTLPPALFLVITKDELPADVGAFQQAATARLEAVVASTHLEPAGTLQFMGPKWNGMELPSTYTIAVPVRARKPVPPDVTFLEVPAHRVAVMQNRGPGSSIAGAWDHLRDVAGARGLKYTSAWTEVQLEPKDGVTAESLIELQLGLD